MDIGGQDIETYQTFVVTWDNTKFTEKLDLTMRNDSVPPKKRGGGIEG